MHEADSHANHEPEPQPSFAPAPRMEETVREEAPKFEAPLAAEPRVEARRVEAPRIEAPRVEAPRIEAPRAPAPRVEAPRVDPKALLASAGLQMVETDRSKARAPAPEPESIQLGRPRREKPAVVPPAPEELVQVETRNK